MSYFYLILGFLIAGAILTVAALVFPSSTNDMRNDR
jgi:predicted outer membrane lipoprotein